MTVSNQTLLGRPKNFVSNQVLGTTLFILTELMFFSALLSAYWVMKSGLGPWAPPDNVRLPVFTALLNVVVLLTSGLLIYLSNRKFGQVSSFYFYSVGTLLGVMFVGFQSYEWVKLLKLGMNMHSGLFSASFFLLVGAHAIHAAGAALALTIGLGAFYKNKLKITQLRALSLFWYFVVIIWPVLYGTVYL